jgi:DNA-binding CsgD family transcriptional regulator
MPEVDSLYTEPPCLNKIESLFELLHSLEEESIELKKEIAFYKSLLNPPDTFIYINDLVQMKKLWSCDNYELLTGYTLEEAAAMGADYFQNAYHDEDKKVFLESKKNIEENPGSSTWHGVYRIHTKNNQKLWIYSVGKILKYDKKNRPWLTLGVGINITDKIEKEMQLIQLMQENLSLKHETIKELLSGREKEILKQLTLGYSSRQIADKLCLSRHTIETHRKNILKKTELKNTAELIKLASHNGWI